MFSDRTHSLHTPELLPFGQHTLPSLRSAQIGANDLLDVLKRDGYDSPKLQIISDALDLMFEAHLEQTRPGDVPYANHTLLVAKVLVKKFGVRDPNDIVAALLHDGPEDQAARILELLGKEPLNDRDRCIEAISESFGADPHTVRRHLTGLTNPDYNGMVEAIRGVGGELLGPALELIGQVRTATEDKRRLLDMTPQEIKNALYLGHIIDLSRGNERTFAIKIADIFTNALHYHLLLDDLANTPTGEAKERLERKSDKLKAKYKPVVIYLRDLFNRAKNDGRTVLTTRADRLLRNKLDFALEHGYSNKAA